MSFREQLSVLMARVPGLLGVILADWEGEAVDHIARMDEFELRVIGAHKGVILNHLREAARHLEEDDDLHEIVITTEHVRTLILPVTADYFLVLLLERHRPFAQALQEARGCLEALRRDVS